VDLKTAVGPQTGEKMALGNNISNLLKIKGENISEFAFGMHISYSAAFNLYHNKTSSISFDLLNRLCRYFGVGPSEIFPYTPDPDKG
jgi:DNA-binding Xre family transcriptional regulator